MRRAASLLAAAAVAAASTVLSATAAHADPSAADWKALRLCESGDNYSINTGNGYFGAYQFDLATWKSVGGVGRPDQASKTEQDFRALYLYRMRGWSPWICAALVGLKEDADGGSGRKPGTTGATPKPGTPAPAGSAPRYPGMIAPGAYSAALKAWQQQAAKRGFGALTGTGWNGDKTKAVAINVQRTYGLPASGAITAETWAAVWKPKPGASSPTPPASKPSAPKPAPAMTRKARFPGFQLKIGMTSPSVAVWQKQMKAMGYGDFEGTGVFGEKTEQAVRELQRAAGLNVVGYIGVKTWEAAWNPRYRKNAGGSSGAAPVSARSGSSTYVPATNASCKVGSRAALAWGGVTMVKGKTYRDLQCFQRQLGHRGFGLTGTGYFGSSTAAVVAEFQSEYNLPRTGKVDAATWKAAWERY